MTVGSPHSGARKVSGAYSAPETSPITAVHQASRTTTLRHGAPNKQPRGRPSPLRHAARAHCAGGWRQPTTRRHVAHPLTGSHESTPPDLCPPAARPPRVYDHLPACPTPRVDGVHVDRPTSGCHVSRSGPPNTPRACEPCPVNRPNPKLPRVLCPVHANPVDRAARASARGRAIALHRCPPAGTVSHLPRNPCFGIRAPNNTSK